MNKYMIMQMGQMVNIVHLEDDISLAAHMQRIYGGTWRWRMEVFLLTKVNL